MKRILLSTILVLAFAASSYAVPTRTLEYAPDLAREYAPAQDQCSIIYYNICSGWVFYWTGYCYANFVDVPLVEIGVCFDLDLCPSDCRHLNNSWFSCSRFNGYGFVDISVFCAVDCCPVGDPLGTVTLNPTPEAGSWYNIPWGGLELCDCDQIIMMASFACVENNNWAPRTDINGLDFPYGNIGVGCETEWRCSGHSFVYTNAVSYCDVYGAGGPMWVSGPYYGCTNFPPIPPGCHDYVYTNGFYTEWLQDIYIDCLGATATETNSWSEIKSLYR
jgi:hypothetical protein